MKKISIALLFAAAFLSLGPIAPAKASLAVRDVLIKGPNSTAVYYYAEDGKRYVFTSDKVYSSWFKDFSNIVSVTATELASLTIGGNITYRPGVKMVKITTDPKVYAVDKGGALRWVTSEQVAIALYGTDWNKKIDDVPDAFFINYKFGEPIYFSTDFSPLNVTASVTTINADKNLPSSFSPRQADSVSSGSVSSTDVQKTQLAPKEIYSRVAPATVLIFTRVPSGYGTGSGVIIESNGLVLTNAHVVSEATSIQVKLNGASEFLSASIVGRDEVHDLAVLQIATPGTYPTARLGDSSILVPGDAIYAMGYPLEIELIINNLVVQPSPSIKDGIVSRTAFLTVNGVTNDYLEISAEIHHGNSGGPLVNEFGEVVGINTRAEFGEGTGVLKFAIPSKRILSMLPALKGGHTTLLNPSSADAVPDAPASCTADTWSCTDWSACSTAGNQSRNCTKTADCPNVDTPSPETVQSCTIPGPSALEISLGSTPVSQTYIKGTANVDFLGINLVARESVITVSALKATGWIDASGGNVLSQGFDDNVSDAAVNDIINQCRLMDGTTMLGNAKVPTSSSTEGTGGILEFSGFNLVIGVGQTKNLKINCDISNLAFRGGDPETVAFSVQGNQVTAKDADGVSVAPTGTANGSSSVRHSIVGPGVMTYQLAPDDTETEAGVVVAGNTVVLGKIRLSASNEELKQTKLRISLLDADQSSVVSMSLFDGATLVAGPIPLSGQNADFSGFNLVVPKDGSKTLTVKGQLNTISGGAVSGTDLQIVADTTSAAAGTFEYRGTSSSTVVTTQATGSDVTGRIKILRKTKPTVSVAALPTTTLTNGTMVLSRVTVAADSGGQVNLKTLKWSINKSDSAVGLTNGAGQAAVREVGQGSHISGTAVMSTDCAATIGTTCIVTSVFGSEQVIAAGTSKTYEMVMTVSGAGSGDALSTNIAADNAMITGALSDNGVAGDSINGTSYHFQWSDDSGVPHNDSVGGSSDWTNGLYVRNIPTDSQTVSAP